MRPVENKQAQAELKLRFPETKEKPHGNVVNRLTSDLVVFNFYNLFVTKFTVVHHKAKRYCYEHLSRAAENTSLFQDRMKYSIFF